MSLLSGTLHPTAWSTLHSTLNEATRLSVLSWWVVSIYETKHFFFLATTHSRIEGEVVSVWTLTTVGSRACWFLLVQGSESWWCYLAWKCATELLRIKLFVILMESCLRVKLKIVRGVFILKFEGTIRKTFFSGLLMRLRRIEEFRLSYSIWFHSGIFSLNAA